MEILWKFYAEFMQILWMNTPIDSSFKAQSKVPWIQFNLAKNPPNLNKFHLDTNRWRSKSNFVSNICRIRGWLSIDVNCIKARTICTRQCSRLTIDWLCRWLPSGANVQIPDLGWLHGSLPRQVKRSDGSPSSDWDGWKPQECQNLR